MSKWKVIDRDPETKKEWTVAKFDSKRKAKKYIRRNPSMHKGNLREGDK